MSQARVSRNELSQEKALKELRRKRYTMGFGQGNVHKELFQEGDTINCARERYTGNNVSKRCTTNCVRECTLGKCMQGTVS